MDRYSKKKMISTAGYFSVSSATQRRLSILLIPGREIASAINGCDIDPKVDVLPMNNQVVSLTTQGDLAYFSDFILRNYSLIKGIHRQLTIISLILPTHFFVYILTLCSFLNSRNYFPFPSYFVFSLHNSYTYKLELIATKR